MAAYHGFWSKKSMQCSLSHRFLGNREAHCFHQRGPLGPADGGQQIYAFLSNHHEGVRTCPLPAYPK